MNRVFEIKWIVVARDGENSSKNTTKGTLLYCNKCRQYE